MKTTVFLLSVLALLLCLVSASLLEHSSNSILSFTFLVTGMAAAVAAGRKIDQITK